MTVGRYGGEGLRNRVIGWRWVGRVEKEIHEEWSERRRGRERDRELEKDLRRKQGEQGRRERGRKGGTRGGGRGKRRGVGQKCNLTDMQDILTGCLLRRNLNI